MEKKHSKKDLHAPAESWLPIETRMVVGSVIMGLAALIVLATLVHLFLLGK
jgi:hypothetical protein